MDLSQLSLRERLSSLCEGDREVVICAARQERDLAPYLERLVGRIPRAAGVEFLCALAQQLRALPADRGPLPAVLLAYAEIMQHPARQSRLN